MIRKKIYQAIDLVEDDSKTSIIYNVSMTIVIIMSIIPLCFKSQNDFFNILDKISVSIFIIDYIVRWCTYDFKTGEDKIKSFIKYPLSAYAIIDLLSILPSIVFINPGLRLFKIIRLFRTFRILKILRFSKSFAIVMNVLKKEKASLLTFGYMAIGYIIISALIMFSVEPDSFKTLFDAIYWATTALTTVGYGDIYPVTVIGKTVSMISSLVGIAFVSLPSGIITAGFISEIYNLKK